MYAIIAGGGKVGFYLGRELIGQGHEVLIVEQLADRAEFIANQLGRVVLRGNADEASTLAEAGAERADVVIAVTGDDEDNLVICQVAKGRFGAKRTIARINEPRNESIFRVLGIDATVNATEVLLSLLEQEIPSLGLIPLMRLRNTDVEILEAVVTVDSKATGKAIAELRLPRDTIVALVIRGATAIFPDPSMVLSPGDEIIALARTEHVPMLRKLFSS